MDFEFIYTLEKLIAAAEAAGQRQAAAKARAVLAAIREQIPDDREAFARRYIRKPYPALQQSAGDFYIDESFDFAIFDKWRHRIAVAAVELEKALRRPKTAGPQPK
jgi:hypothetical protein